MAAAAAGFTTLSLKEIRQHEDFSGKESDFESWAFPFEAETEELGWGHLVQAAAAHPEPTTTAHERKPKSKLVRTCTCGCL